MSSLFNIARNKLRDLWVDDVVVVVDDDVAKLDHVPRGKVRAPLILLPELVELFERVYTPGSRRLWDPWLSNPSKYSHT